MNVLVFGEPSVVRDTNLKTGPVFGGKVKIANEAKVGCPVSKALAATTIELEAVLL